MCPISFYQSRLELSRTAMNGASSASIGARARLPPVDDDEIQIADVDHEAKRLARDENRIAAIQRIDQQQYAAADREKPERHRDHALARAFGCNPLHHKAHGEKPLRHEPENDPAVEFYHEDIVQI